MTEHDDEAARHRDTILRTALTDVAVRTAYIIGGITTTRGHYCEDHSIVLYVEGGDAITIPPRDPDQYGTAGPA